MLWLLLRLQSSRSPHQLGTRFPKSLYDGPAGWGCSRPPGELSVRRGWGGGEKCLCSKKSLGEHQFVSSSMGAAAEVQPKIRLPALEESCRLSRRSCAEQEQARLEGWACPALTPEEASLLEVFLRGGEASRPAFSSSSTFQCSEEVALSGFAFSIPNLTLSSD